MPKFQFRLKTLLAIHESTRQERCAQLAEGLAAQRALELARATVERELAEQRQTSAGPAGRGVIDVERLTATDRYRNVLRARLATMAQNAAALATEIDARQQALAAADREVRVLDKLRERQYEQFGCEQTRREFNMADEIAARGTIRDKTV
jgi:flagellar export protein FliJ